MIFHKRTTKGCLIILIFLPLIHATFDMVDKSGDALVIQGTEHNLFCESSQPYEFCKWIHVESGKTCRIVSDEISKAGACKDDEHMIWQLTDTRCGLALNSITRSNIGLYKCMMGLLSEDDGPVSFTESMTLDVAVPPMVMFDGIFADVSGVTLDEGQEVIVECRADGGYPEPNLRVSISQHSDSSIDQTDSNLDHIEEMEELSMNEDGTFNIRSAFRFIPDRHHCGKYLKCEAVQSYEDGNDIFSNENPVSTKLTILFPPEPFEQRLSPFEYFEGDQEVVVELAFISNPEPENNEAIWHINPSGEASPESTVLQADHDYEDKYKALPLNVSGGHIVTAKLIISNPTNEEDAYAYYLHVITSKGDLIHKFAIQQTIVETSTIEDITSYPSLDGSNKTGFPQNEEFEKDGLSTPGIVGVIIAVVVIVMIVVLIVFARKLKIRGCCKSYNPVDVKPQVDVHTSEEGGADLHRSIIKNGNREENMKIDDPYNTDESVAIKTPNNPKESN